MTAKPKPTRVYFTDAFAEQYRIAGGAKANKKAKLLVDMPQVAQVFETPSGRELAPSGRISDIRTRIESKLNSDDWRHSDKHKHVPILDLLKRIANGAELHQAGLADERSYADIGRATVELIGVPLNHARREGRSYSANGSIVNEPWRTTVANLKDDLVLALDKFDRITQKQIARSREGAMKLAALNFTLDCVARTLKLPTECEIRARLETIGYKFIGRTSRNIDRQWNRLFQWWREVFLISK